MAGTPEILLSEPPVASRAFTMADQRLFAGLSGDRNPMHLDTVAARRTQAGAPVVHGVHALLWSLEALIGAGFSLGALASAKVRFERFLYLDRAVTLRVVRREATTLKFEVTDDGLLLMSVNLEFGERDRPAASVTANEVSPTERSAPAAPPFEAMGGLSGHLTSPAEDQAFQAMFPALSADLDARRVSTLAQLSTLVGMVCPGLHSIFSSFSIRLTLGTGAPGLTFQTIKADDRFRMVTMAFSGWGAEGQVLAFARREPVAPPGMTSLATRVEPLEFAHVSALIIGGSRGLGAATAKLIAAGGGRVTISYARGQREAERLKHEIVEARGPQACRVVELDVRNPEAALDIFEEPFNQLYYFATPQIFRQKSAVFSSDVYADFSALYVDAFYNLVQQLRARSQGVLAIFYPSSVAVTERPKGMTEYAMAKAAGELLCADMQRSDGQLRMIVSRIPRTATDQTATVLPVESADPVDVLLPLVQQMSGR